MAERDLTSSARSSVVPEAVVLSAPQATSGPARYRWETCHGDIGLKIARGSNNKMVVKGALEGSRAHELDIRSGWVFAGAIHRSPRGGVAQGLGPGDLASMTVEDFKDFLKRRPLELHFDRSITTPDGLVEEADSFMICLECTRKDWGKSPYEMPPLRRLRYEGSHERGNAKGGGAVPRSFEGS